MSLANKSTRNASTYSFTDNSALSLLTAGVTSPFVVTAAVHRPCDSFSWCGTLGCLVILLETFDGSEGGEGFLAVRVTP